MITSSHSAVSRTFSCPMLWRFKPHFLVSTTFISYYLRHLLLSEDLCISFHPLHPNLVKQPSPRPQLPNPLTSAPLCFNYLTSMVLTNPVMTIELLITWELFTYGFLFQISHSLLKLSNMPFSYSVYPT